MKLAAAKASPAKTPAKAGSPTPILNRYTSLPVALDMLHCKHITLLTPETWEDSNDAFYLERYRSELRLRCVLAICFSVHRETFHHWRVFSAGAAGVCIEFDKTRLLNGVPTNKGFTHGPVDYKWIGELQKQKPPLKKWPFLKRKPFEDEREYRIIFESATESLRAKPIPIELSSIRKITLSPWLPRTVGESVIKVVKRIDGCASLEVEPSTLIDNSGWRKAIA